MSYVFMNKCEQSGPKTIQPLLLIHHVIRQVGRGGSARLQSCGVGSQPQVLSLIIEKQSCTYVRLLHRGQRSPTVLESTEHASVAMRLLHRLPSGTYELTYFDHDHPPPYAILSHTWEEGQEVSYQELIAGVGRDKKGFEKIRFCGERAAADKLQYFWVDTCCIDKTDSDELETAINYMFRWYQRSSQCYVYLSDVSMGDHDPAAFPGVWADAFRRSRWFTRGWTLQELIAPGSVEFFSKEGKRLGSKITLEHQIRDITRIPIRALRGHNLVEFGVEERMSWVASRVTTVKEDRAYCLLGIFGVFLPVIRGEGEEHAMRRLRKEIREQQQELEIEQISNGSHNTRKWALTCVATDS